MSEAEKQERTTSAEAGAVIVSGATGALGGTIAERLADRGRALVLPVRSDADALRERLPDATIVEADLLDPTATRRVAQAATDGHGGIAALINVAGGFAMGSALELDSADVERQLDLNFRTAVHLTSACLPSMVDAGRGTIVAVSAGAARGGASGKAAYASSKAALEAYMGSLRAEVEARGVAVSLLVPEGTIDTASNREAMPDADPNGWIAQDALAEATVYLLGLRRRGRVAEVRVHP